MDDMIHRKEYERVCQENKQLRDLVKKITGEKLDPLRTMETISETRKHRNEQKK
jgi:hypothetical protein|tara:strand:- start:1202 stop:1363 length:162 start_codon:yes stop_codon:yes gene_type:complete